MKKSQQYCTVFLIAVSYFLQISPICSQAPAGMNYQAVARDATGDILANRNVSMRFTITNDSGGPILYRETQSTITNQFGLFTLSVGRGTPISGTFSSVNWASVTPWLEVDMDATGGTDYVNMGTSQLLSVPYSLFAQTSASGLGGSGTTNYLSKFTSSNIIANSLLFDNGTHVGINTLTPAGKLHIKGSEDVSQLIIDSNSDQISPLIKLRDSNGADLMWIHSDDNSNTFVGIGAGALNNGGGLHNTFLGSHAGYSNTTGSLNTGIGQVALYNNIGGDNNTATGYGALYENTEGDRNTANGGDALNNNINGILNTAIGWSSLFSNTSGHFNAALGSRALEDNTVGQWRTAMGGASNSTGSDQVNNTGLGFNADCTASNQVRIGNSDVTSIGGYVDWTNISDARFKCNVSENVIGLAFINALRPVTYNMDLQAIDDWWAENYNERDSSLAQREYDKEKIVYSGFVAQEVEATARSLGYDFSGVDAPKNDKDFYGLRYGTFVVPLVKAVQEQQVQIEELRRENQELRTLYTEHTSEQQQQINALQSALLEIKAELKMQ